MAPRSSASFAAAMIEQFQAQVRAALEDFLVAAEPHLRAAQERVDEAEARRRADVMIAGYGPLFNAVQSYVAYGPSFDGQALSTTPQEARLLTAVRDQVLSGSIYHQVRSQGNADQVYYGFLQLVADVINERQQVPLTRE